MAKETQNTRDQQSNNMNNIVAAVEQLAKVYQSSGADRLELECEGMMLRLSKNERQILVDQLATTYAAAPAIAAAATTTPASAAPQAATAEATTTTEPVDPSITQVKAPLVGTFYAAPAPDADPFVVEGQRVHEGDVLCIVEAMKFMNEICAPCDGTVETIYATNEQPLSFDEVIMSIRS